MAGDKSVLIEFFGNYPLVRVLDFLIENRGFDYSKTEISKQANVSWGSLYSLWSKLDGFGIVAPTRSFGNTTLYKLNEKNSFVKKILKIELDLIKFYADIDTKAHLKGKAPSPMPSTA
ncbi:MAG: hypothetical protein L6243_05705 [Candidatus Altiarchaeales archaeon]|nr:hypothetical protein [Candidatus Altiarchaeota archaeon]MBU4342174.1 hypothetical protein [Candidatus Altiarchaeota archaeon]MBU4437681.1 hypothetical protein [Candidatus Altiarchaeota archaeon]MCG2783066.1 hypothetical protein [Candidatus Altiarchaeales archaeon]